MDFNDRTANPLPMVEEISADELHRRLAAGDDLQVVDIRPPEGFGRGHIPGAVNLPLDRFAREVDRHEWGDEIVVACPIGESSRQAARLLESYEGVAEDATVRNLTDGYAGWDFELEIPDASAGSAPERS